MFCSDYASQGHINELDQEFDSSMANLNKLLDQALDKVHPANDQPEENDANYVSGNGTKDFEGNEGKLQSARTYTSLQIDSQSLHEYMNRDVKNSPSAFQNGNQLWSPGKLITPKGLSNNKTYLRSLNKGSYSSEMSELQLEFKIDQNRIYESPLDTAQRSKALTERNHKGFKPDEIRTKPDSFHHHQRWASQYSFTNPLNDFLSPRDNDGSGFWSTDWLRNNQSRSDLNLKQDRKISNSYHKSRTMSRTSEDNLQVSFQTDIEATKAAAQLANKIQTLNKNENLATISINKNKQVNSSKKGSEEMEQIGECLEYENKSPEPTRGSLQNRKYNQKESRVTLDDSYGLKEELGGVVLNKTPTRKDGIKICYQESENSKHYSPNAYNSKSPYYKKPSIVQTPNKVNPLETRFLSPENSYISKKSDQFGSNRKEEQLSQFFDENIGEYERNLRLINKYATTEIIESLDQFPAEKEALIDSLIRSRTPSVMVSSHKNDAEIDNDGAKLVVMCSPIKQKDVDQNLVSVYQQVSEIYDDGAKYIGEKLLGKRHGKGTYYYKEGYKYEGSWEEDNMSGFGTLWLTEDLKWYEGEWLNNLFHGKGSLYNLYTEPLDPNTSYANDFSTVGNGWVKYDGQFVEGLKDGLGSLYFSNNDLYIGKFKRNKAEGRGAYTKADSFVVVGRWESDQLKETY